MNMLNNREGNLKLNRKQAVSLIRNASNLLQIQLDKIKGGIDSEDQAKKDSDENDPPSPIIRRSCSKTW